MEVVFSIQAFSKMILHVTKYPQNSVNGILLKKITSGGDDQGKIYFSECIPILHMSKFVSPMMEIALAQIEQYIKPLKYEMVGYYQANQSLSDNTPDFVATRIAEKLSEVNPNLLVVMINNDQLNSNLECAPFTIYKLSDGRLKGKETTIKLEPDQQGALSTASALIQAKAYRSLVDFDNHLDNISLNYWSNPELNEKIKQLSS